MLVFQGVAQAGQEKSSMSPEISRQLEAKFKDKSARYDVITSNGTVKMSLAELTDYAAKQLKALSGQDLLKVLMDGSLGAYSKTEMIEIIQSRISWFGESSLAELEKGGSSALKANLLTTAKSTEWVKNLVKAAIFSQNADNAGSALNPLDLQGSMEDLKTATIIGTYAATTGCEATFSAFGSLSKVELDAGAGHLCFDIKNAMLGAMCLPFDMNQEAYSGASHVQIQRNIIGTAGQDFTRRAEQLFGKEFASLADRLADYIIRYFAKAAGKGNTDFVMQNLTTYLEAKEMQDFYQQTSGQTSDAVKKEERA
jgi:hypothetical protein